MKKIINNLLSIISAKEKSLNNGNHVVSNSTVFTSVDLWNIHRNGRVRPQRRFI